MFTKLFSSILVRNTRQDRDKSKERKRWRYARTHRQSLQMRVSQTGEKAVPSGTTVVVLIADEEK